ncbi:hypothetical protein FGADI_1020 [Fusarium gaditjirri]|uniref:Uncharacterized protein n=1 Tax=Fusarium gaditjirri TaxID=282569 RepID=A0A8H4TLR0_9HYPO|nr:hypothetical protein FGADI_1020 [Fusarium gaditjirri]
MASLVPIKFSEITAKYYGLTGKLSLHAKGTIPWLFLAPFFDQKLWTGELKFAVNAYSDDFSKPRHEKEVEFDHELAIHLPIPDFNNESVLIETAFGISKVDIDKFIKLVAASYENGFIKWTISWDKVPDLAHDLQRVSVITAIEPEVKIKPWPPIPDPKDIQPYLIHRLWMLSDQKE